jgi:predicted DNA binding CopG/RHH family protein
MAEVNEDSSPRDAEHERRLQEDHDRIRAMSDRELEALLEHVEDRSPAEWTVDQLNAEVELDRRLGIRGETTAEMEKHPPRTVPISIRMPVELLDRVREEARRRSTPYQRLIRELVEAGLAAGARPVARLEVSADLLGRIAAERSVIVEVRRAS